MYNQYVLLRKRSNKEIKLQSKPWITKEIINLSKQKDKLYIASLYGIEQDKNNTNAFEIALLTKRTSKV